MSDVNTTGLSETKITPTTTFKLARTKMSLDCKIAIADAEQKIMAKPTAGYMPASANCSRLFVKSIGKHKQVIVAYSYFSDLDHAYLLDAYYFVGDPYELRNELDWLGKELVGLEKRMGVELLTRLHSFNDNI